MKRLRNGVGEAFTKARVVESTPMIGAPATAPQAVTGFAETSPMAIAFPWPFIGNEAAFGGFIPRSGNESRTDRSFYYTQQDEKFCTCLLNLFSCENGKENAAMKNELSTAPGKSYQQPPEVVKKEEAGKRNSPLESPYRERAKNKEQIRCVCTEYSQNRARVRAYMRARGWSKRRLYDEAGAAADEIMATCFGTFSDHNIWAARMYQYPWAIAEFCEMAHEKAACYRAGELRNPLTAFQAWVNKAYPDPRKGGAR